MNKKLFFIPLVLIIISILISGYVQGNSFSIVKSTFETFLLLTIGGILARGIFGEGIINISLGIFGAVILISQISSIVFLIRVILKREDKDYWRLFISLTTWIVAVLIEILIIGPPKLDFSI